jgi:hypothetical protein
MLLNEMKTANLTANLDTTLSSKIRGKLLWAKFSGSPGLVDRLQSGKRLYQCRAVRVNAIGGSDAPSSIAVFLERGTSRAIPLAQVAENFKLNSREQDVLQLSFGGRADHEGDSGANQNKPEHR